MDSNKFVLREIWDLERNSIRSLREMLRILWRWQAFLESKIERGASISEVDLEDDKRRRLEIVQALNTELLQSLRLLSITKLSLENKYASPLGFSPFEEPMHTHSHEAEEENLVSVLSKLNAIYSRFASEIEGSDLSTLTPNELAFIDQFTSST